MSFWTDPNPKDAFILSWVSVVLTLIAAITGIVFYETSGSTLCLVYGLENFVDLLSSIVVVWRFYAPGEVTKELEEQLEKREQRASIAISFILILLGIFVIGGGTDDLIKGPETEAELSLILGISFVSILVFGTMATFKFHYSKKLDSPSLYKDGLCSLLGTVLSIALFINSLIIEKNPAVWYLDPVVSIVCGIVAAVIGIHAIYIAYKKQGLPIFSPHWWMVSQGESDGGGQPAATSANPKLSEVV